MVSLHSEYGSTNSAELEIGIVPNHNLFQHIVKKKSQTPGGHVLTCQLAGDATGFLVHDSSSAKVEITHSPARCRWDRHIHLCGTCCSAHSRMKLQQLPTSSRTHVVSCQQPSCSRDTFIITSDDYSSWSEITATDVRQPNSCSTSLVTASDCRPRLKLTA